jgi:hypothetical protein
MVLRKYAKSSILSPRFENDLDKHCSTYARLLFLLGRTKADWVAHSTRRGRASKARNAAERVDGRMFKFSFLKQTSPPTSPSIYIYIRLVLQDPGQSSINRERVSMKDAGEGIQKVSWKYAKSSILSPPPPEFENDLDKQCSMYVTFSSFSPPLPNSRFLSNLKIIIINT